MAIYYVAPAASGGSDSNPGTIDSPWLTLSKAISVAVAGDTVNFRTGTYTISAQTNFTHAGSAGNPITFQNYNGETVVFSCGGGFGTALVFKSSYNTFKGFEINGNGSPGQLVYIHSLTAGTYISNVIIDGCIIHNSHQEAVRIKYGTNHTITNCQVYDCGVNGGFNGECVYVGTDVSQEGSFPDNTSGITVSYCTLYNSTDECIDIKPHTVNSNFFNNIIGPRTGLASSGGGAGIIQTATSGQTGNSGNNIYNNIIKNIQSGGGAAGAKANGIWCQRGGTLIYNNVIYGCNEYGIYVDGHTPSSTITMYFNTLWANILGGYTNVTYSGTGQLATVLFKRNIGSSLTNNLTGTTSNFVDASTFDFRLAGPPNTAIDPPDLGLGIATDILGNPRDATPDYGAYEYIVPGVTNIVTTNIGDTTFNINWETQQASSTKTLFGLTASYNGTTALDASAVTSHASSLFNLTPNTLYHFQCVSSTGSADQTVITNIPPVTSLTVS